jgi:GTP-binding protein HflX
MKKLSGNTSGLKPAQLKRLENLSHRGIPSEFIITPELAADLAHLSSDIRRQIGLLIHRNGKIVQVLIGDSQKIVIPHLSDYRPAPGKLKGLRCVHTHLKKNEGLSRDDLTDLSLLRLDMMAAVTINENGGPHRIHVALIQPGNIENPTEQLPVLRPDQLNIGCMDRILAIEAVLSEKDGLRKASRTGERAVLIGVSDRSRREQALDSLEELRELARSNHIKVIDTLFQQRKKIDPKFLLGRGKLNELTIFALQKGATLIIFDQELTPAQIRSITDQIEMKVIDRSQLILDIFAQRAQSREGKIQVELAQLKYLLPRLITKNTAMSRLTGGIGGRGPGETKLEINRRRVRERIARLTKELEQVKKQRGTQKARRLKNRLPIISIIGYTNAGKSTLLNALTDSEVTAENRLFATLDPSSRRLRFPKEMEVIITDTVGFIRDLPKELMVAFRHSKNSNMPIFCCM